MAEGTMFSGESKNVEYKVTVPDRSENYMKTIVAFANTQGGKLLIGIEDKTHQVVDVDSTEFGTYIRVAGTGRYFWIKGSLPVRYIYRSKRL